MATISNSSSASTNLRTAGTRLPRCLRPRPSALTSYPILTVTDTEVVMSSAQRRCIEWSGSGDCITAADADAASVLRGTQRTHDR